MLISDDSSGGGLMRLLTLAFTALAYACFGLITAVLLSRMGGGGAAIAAGLGAVALGVALHAMVGQRFFAEGIRHDVNRMRDANLIFADELERTQNDLSALSTIVHDEKQKRSAALSTEVRMLEDLVRRMSDTMQARLQPPPQPANEDLRATTVAKAAPAVVIPLRDPRADLLQTVRDALAENRVDLYLQPVVSLPQRRTVFYESFSRLRDAKGRLMLPAEYLPAAEPEGLVSVIDNLLLFRCVQIVRRLAKQDRKVGIFCNVSLASLGDDDFFPQFLEFLQENKDLSNALIFEVGQAAFEARDGAQARAMAKLADLGFRFSLDKVTDLNLDARDLARSDVKFIKVAASVLAEQLTEVDGRLTLGTARDMDASDFTELQRRYGVEIIAEKIETERQVVEVLDLDVRYGQGHLFGEPRAIREQVLAETAPPADFVARTLKRQVA